MRKLTIDDVDVKGKRVLTRVDFNVPLNENLEVTDDTRLRASLPTIKRIIHSGGKAILMSHLGRPKGKMVETLRLEPAARRLSQLLGKEVLMLPDCVGEEVEEKISSLKTGEVVLLENLRFHPEEEANDPEFARKLAALGDIYVNDAFGTAHRAHASTEGVTRYINPCVAGYLMQKELQYLGQVIENPEKPFVAILGGAKISGKIEVIENFLDKVDALLIGGGMSYTFFKAQGVEIGNSLVEADKIDLAGKVLADAQSKKIELLLPLDNVIANEITDTAETQNTPDTSIPAEWIGVDIGPKTVETFEARIINARTVVWNGPMGIFEKEKFAKGTMGIAQALAQATERGAITVVGGGDSVAALAKAGVTDKISHVSTGGGASLEFLAGRKLPGVEALTDK